MITFLDWNDEKMSIGIETIDIQHKELLKIINQLSTSIHTNSQKKDILVIINELINYADYHFKTEEELFDRLNFDEKDSHKKEHSYFIQKFIDIKNNISSDEFYLNKNAIEIANDVFNYLINWFLNHIAGTDREYIELFKKNGL